MSKLLKKTQAILKSYWHHHKVWSVIIGFLIFGFIISPLIDIAINYAKDGSDPVYALKDLAISLGEIIAFLVLVPIVLALLSGGSGGGSPSGTALSNLENRSSVHPQSDYRAQDRAAQEARDAAAQGREALNALERAGGDPTTMQKLKWEIDRADRDAKNFQEWAED